jgi:hypothetical protein
MLSTRTPSRPPGRTRIRRALPLICGVSTNLALVIPISVGAVISSAILLCSLASRAATAAPATVPAIVAPAAASVAAPAAVPVPPVVNPDGPKFEDVITQQAGPYAGMTPEEEAKLLSLAPPAPGPKVPAEVSVSTADTETPPEMTAEEKAKAQLVGITPAAGTFPTKSAETAVQGGATPEAGVGADPAPALTPMEIEKRAAELLQPSPVFAKDPSPELARQAPPPDSLPAQTLTPEERAKFEVQP